MRRPRDDEGFSTVVGIALMLVILFVATAVSILGAFAVARHRVEAAADLAALSAAKHALEGPVVACQAAAEVARAQAVTVTNCTLDGLDAVVVVAFQPAGSLRRFGPIRGRARAGAR